MNSENRGAIGSEGKEDGGYQRQTAPEKKPMVVLKSPTVVRDLYSNGADLQT